MNYTPRRQLARLPVENGTALNSMDEQPGALGGRGSRAQRYGSTGAYFVLLGVLLAGAGPAFGDAPTAVADSNYSTGEDMPLNVSAPGVLGNDTDPEDDSLTAGGSAGPLLVALLALAWLLRRSGRAARRTVGSFALACPLVFCALLGAPLEAAAQLGPNAVDDAYTVEKGSKNTTFFVLENDTAGFGSLRIVAVSKPDQGGKVDVRSRGTELRYTPEGKFAGVETFDYQVRNSLRLIGTATVTVTVTPKNDEPTFTSTPPLSANEDEPYTYNITATDADGDPLTIAVPKRPAWLDTFTDNGDGTATLSGTPTQADVGDYDVTVTVTDSVVDKPVEQRFKIKVLAVNDAPVAAPDTYSGNESTTLTVNAGIGVLANDFDVDGDSLSAILDSNVANGALVLNGNGSFTYTPGEQFSGLDSFTYHASDGELSSDTVAVTITISSVNDPPRFTSTPELTANQDEVYTYAIAATDPDGDSLTIAAPTRPAWLGSFTDNGNGTAILSGTPALSDIGVHDVTVTVSDGTAAPVQQSFTITVAALDTIDLSLTVAAEPNPASVDETVEWNFTISNSNPLLIVDEAALDAEFSGVPFAITDTGACAVVGPALSCAVGPIPPDGSVTVTLTGRATEPGDVLVTGAVGSAAVGGVVLADPNLENNSAVTTLNVGEAFSNGPAQTITGSGTMRGLASGDIDGDGFVDLAVATDLGNSTRIYFSVPMDPDDPNGEEFRRLATSPVSLGDTAGDGRDALLVDLDNDGDLDLVVANGAARNPEGNAVFINDLVEGLANLVPASALGNRTSYAVAAADLDGDGFNDLIFGNGGPNGVFRNLGDGTFVELPSLGNDDTRGLAIADFDGDGRPDVVFANSDAAGTLHLNQGAGLFGDAIEVEPDRMESVAASDVDRDGRADLIFGRRTAPRGVLPENGVYLNVSSGPGNASFAEFSAFGSSPTIQVVSADFSLDAVVDVVSLNETGTHQIFDGDANGTFILQPQQFSSAPPTGSAVADFNNDGRLDLAVAAGPAGVSLFLNDGRGNLGRGDLGAPTLELMGQTSVTLTIGDTFNDTGATASDAVDGEISSRIIVTNPVDTAVIGTYTVTYDVADRSGNKAAPVKRTVTVGTREASGGGGGGAIDPSVIILLVLSVILSGRRLGLSRR